MLSMRNKESPSMKKSSSVKTDSEMAVKLIQLFFSWYPQHFHHANVNKCGYSGISKLQRVILISLYFVTARQFIMLRFVHWNLC